jgi:hypothetical protein
MSEPNYLLTDSHLISNPSTQIMRVDLDGGFTVNESIPATDAAKEVLRIMKEQWFADTQATKIRELQSNVTELENRLRALWDKLEGERKFYDQRIRELEIAGNAMYAFINPPSPSMRTIRMDNLLQGWDDAKIGKGVKP